MKGMSLGWVSNGLPNELVCPVYKGHRGEDSCPEEHGRTPICFDPLTPKKERKQMDRVCLLYSSHVYPSSMSVSLRWGNTGRERPGVNSDFSLYGRKQIGKNISLVRFLQATPAQKKEKKKSFLDSPRSLRQEWGCLALHLSHTCWSSAWAIARCVSLKHVFG